MNKIKLYKIEKIKNKIQYEYEIEGDWSKYFRKKYNFFIEYDFNVEDIPNSICTIPFVCDVLPMIWIFNATLEIEEIDSKFYNSIPEFKQGFINMYPNVEFKGKIKVNEIVDNQYKVSSKVGQFFSGGVDAFSTLITHINEKPLLINLRGSDVSIKNKKASDNVKKDITETAKKLNLQVTFVKSTFRNVIKQKKIDKYVRPIIHDGYWHGFQHGLAIISHGAPIAYKYKLKTIYIAASFTKENRVPCASDPEVDNYVKLSSTNINHDGFYFNRNDKIKNIIRFSKQNNMELKLRVCLMEESANNCCNCEKCYRTICEIIVNDYDPKKLGFYYDDSIFKKMKWDFDNRIVLGHLIHWKRIQKSFNDKKNKYINDERFNWILDYDFNTNKNLKKEFYRIYFALKRRINKYLWKK